MELVEPPVPPVPPPPSELDELELPPPTEEEDDDEDVVTVELPLELPTSPLDDPTMEVLVPLLGAPPFPRSVAGSGKVQAPAMPNAIAAQQTPRRTIDLT